MRVTCPRCKLRKEDYPMMKLMVSECFHPMCDVCVNHYFVAGIGNCPVCQLQLRQKSFREQQYEDVSVEKDIQIRQRVMRDYNKQEEDFESSEAYNNYLEEVETIISNLCNNKDVAGTNELMLKYKQENREQIERNRNRLSRSRQELDDILANEREMLEKRNRDEVEKRAREQENMEALLDELELGKDANEVVRKYAQRVDSANEWDYLPPPKPWVPKNKMKDDVPVQCPTDDIRTDPDALNGANDKSNNK